MAKKKKRTPTRKSHSLTFEVNNYSLASGIGSALGIHKFKDVPDSHPIWNPTTYLKIEGDRLWNGEKQLLEMTIYGHQEARTFAETKGDYLLHDEPDEYGRRQPKSRIRRGYHEHVYREIKGFAYCAKYRTEENFVCW